ncbi:MAG: bacteriohemerythrin [Candidatus Omnitrophota bacterium]
MSFLDWKPEEYGVGVKECDNQHQKLIKLINELYDAMIEKKTRESLGKILNELVDYTVYHFSAEEDLFKITYYPEAVVQKLEHEKFTKTVTDFKKKFEETSTTLISVELLKFLKDWLLQHISIVDKKYGPYLNSKGVF